MSLPDALKREIESLIEKNDVVLFMKGTRHLPQCGFSAAVVEILDEYLPRYETVNVLADPSLRDGIKVFSDWPTIPQLYVKGEFVGGADIVREMHSTGELTSVLGQAPAPVDAPSITITESAARAFAEAVKEEEHPDLRLEITSRFQYALSFGPALDGDVTTTAGGLVVRMDRGTARRASGMTIDFVDGPGGTGFKIENPNEPPKVRQMSVHELKAQVEDGTLTHVYDVRPDAERAIAALPFAEQLSETKAREIASLPKDTPLAFLCRSGNRSQGAAEHFLQQGFTTVYNVKGGILAWSSEIDPSVAQY